MKFTMTKEDMEKLLDASKPVPLIMLQCGMPLSPQARANTAWKELGDRMGFDHMTVRPVAGESQLVFTATPKATS